MLRILEHPTPIPRPVSMILAYPALDFNFTSWMSPANLRVLRTEQSTSHVPGIAQTKDHMRHKSPLSVVPDVQRKRTKQKSWGEALSSKLPGLGSPTEEKRASIGAGGSPVSPTSWTTSIPRSMSAKVAGWLAPSHGSEGSEGGSRHGDQASDSESGDEEEEDDDDDGTVTVRAMPREADGRREEDKSLRERVKTPKEERKFQLSAIHASPDNAAEAASPTVAEGKTEVKEKKRKRAPIGTRLTMTSRVGYFQDRIISPSMASRVFCFPTHI